MKRILVGGVVGGIVLFAWGAISHMLLPVGEMGIQSLPNDDALMAAMRDSISQPGLYMFPGMDTSGGSSEEERKAWEQKHVTGPAGILVYHPRGEQPMSAKQLLTELGSDIVAALLMAYVLTRVGGAFGPRVLLATLMGLFTWVSHGLPYWNWYGFPGGFVMGEAIDDVAGSFLAGLALAAIVKPAP